MEQLLQRYIRGKVSEEERLKVVSWLDESPDNMREFLALRKLYDISLWHTDTIGYLLLVDYQCYTL